jgi:hypothetical protein
MAILSSSGALLTKIAGGHHKNGYEKVLCRDSSRPLSQKDGLSLCVIQSGILIFSLLGVTFAWIAQVIFLYLRVVRKVNTEQYVNRGILAVLTLSLAGLVYAASKQVLGWNGFFTWCIFSRKPNPEDGNAPREVVFLLIAMAALLAIVGTFCIASVLYHYAYNIWRKSWLVGTAGPESNTPGMPGARRSSKWLTEFAKLGAPAMLFHLGFATIWIGVLYLPMSRIVYPAGAQRIYTRWRQCTFSMFFEHRVGVLHENYDYLWSFALPECGETPRYRINKSNSGINDFAVIQFILSGQALIIAMIFLPSRIARRFAPAPENRAVIRYKNWMDRMRSLASVPPARVSVQPLLQVSIQAPDDARGLPVAPAPMPVQQGVQQVFYHPSITEEKKDSRGSSVPVHISGLQTQAAVNSRRPGSSSGALQMVMLPLDSGEEKRASVAVVAATL